MSSIPRDYDTDLVRPTISNYSVAGDVHDEVGPRLVEQGAARVLDLACGRGRLLDAFPVDRWIGLDGSPNQLANCPGDGRKVLGDGGRLPFADGAFDAVTAMYCLYHFDDPSDPISEAHRVLRDGGWFVTCTPSLTDAPELVTHLEPSTFDAETAEDQVAAVFGAEHVTGEWWDGPYVELADDEAVRNYVRGHLIPPEHVRADVTPPLTLTKRGVVVWARKS
jgi:SAM-dependent methyltransferase